MHNNKVIESSEHPEKVVGIKTSQKARQSRKLIKDGIF